MAIKIAGTTVINNSRGVENMSNIEGNYTNFHGIVTSIANDLDMSKPVMSRTLTADTTFTASNLATGKVCLLMLDIGSSQYIPTWPASIKWPGAGTEPDWDATGVTQWLVCFTCWDNTTIRATATGWGTGTQAASVDLGSTARKYQKGFWWDESTNPHTAGTASMTFQTTGGVSYSANSPTGTFENLNYDTQTGTSSWGTAVTGSDYEIKYQFTTNHSGGSVTANPGNNVWLSLGSARTWTVSTTTTGESAGRITGTVSIRRVSDNVVLDTQTQALEVTYYGAGVGNTCLTNNMLVQVQGKGLIRVYDLEVGDMIADDSEEMFTKIIDINKDHPREGYYTVDGWLEITHDHPMLIDNNWVLPNDYEGDKQYHRQDTDTVYIETTSGTFSVFNEDGSEHIIVSGDYADKENV